MAIHQDYWLNTNKYEAREWLSNLRIGETLLHPPPHIELNKTSPTGDNFETVVIKEKTDHYVLISYPNRTAHWDKKLPIKYAFAVRPINSINSKRNNNNILVLNPFRHNNNKILAPKSPSPTNNNNIKNRSNHLSTTFKKKHKKKLNPFRDNNKILVSISPSPSPTPTPTTNTNNIPEITPPAADKTLFNKLHSIRSQTTTYKPLKHTYAETRSKNERNRNIFKKSLKKKGYEILEEQRKNYQKTRTEIDNRLQKEGKKQLKRYLHNNSQQAHINNSKPNKRKRDNVMNEIEPPLKRIRLLNSNNNCIDYKKENETLKQEIKTLKQKLDSLECKSERIKAMNLNELNELKVTMQNKIKLIEDTEKEFIDNTYKCIACMHNSKNISFIDGCSHVTLCDKCEQSLKTKCCPICQIPYTNVKKINF